MKKILKNIVLAMLVLVMLWVAFNIIRIISWIAMLPFHIGLKALSLLLVIVLVYTMFSLAKNKLSDLFN